MRCLLDKYKTTVLAMKQKIKTLKLVHSVVSAILFFSLLAYCVTVTKDYSIADISLSRYGLLENTHYAWNIGLFVTGLLLLVNVVSHVNKYYENSSRKNLLVISFALSIVCMLLTAVFDMTHDLHNYVAIIYFVGFTVSMYSFGHYLIKSSFRVGVTAVVFSLVSAVLPLLFLRSTTALAIPEIVHSTVVFLWVILLNFEVEYVSFLKRIGL